MFVVVVVAAAAAAAAAAAVVVVIVWGLKPTLLVQKVWKNEINTHDSLKNQCHSSSDKQRGRSKPTTCEERTLFVGRNNTMSIISANRLKLFPAKKQQQTSKQTKLLCHTRTMKK